eukprot:scaffold22496_cov27-Tisochrysis_lutea.AAC.2
MVLLLLLSLCSRSLALLSLSPSSRSLFYSLVLLPVLAPVLVLLTARFSLSPLLFSSPAALRAQRKNNKRSTNQWNPILHHTLFLHHTLSESSPLLLLSNHHHIELYYYTLFSSSLRRILRFPQTQGLLLAPARSLAPVRAAIPPSLAQTGATTPHPLSAPLLRLPPFSLSLPRALRAGKQAQTSRARPTSRSPRSEAPA